MLWVLLWKDLRRARRNPWPYVINLALPICITALIGLAFGPSSKGGPEPIRMAIVDEDDSAMGRFLRGAADSGDFKKRMEARFLGREEALKEINNNKTSAVLIIPKGFTQNYLTGKGPLALELIKNPAQSFYPAIVEELLEVMVAGLNAVSRNLQADLPEWKEVLAKEGRPDTQRIADLVVRVGKRFEKAEHYLFPPLVRYTKSTQQQKTGGDSPAMNIFAFVLPGLAAMFLLMLADQAIRDQQREVSTGTLDRYRTLRDKLLPFVMSKAVFAVVLVAIGSLILFGGGVWIFGIHWEKPIQMSALVVAYGVFAAGLMAFIGSLTRSERRGDSVNSMLIMCLSFLGGSFFPARQLPAVFREHVVPLMPNNWFIEAVRELQGGGASMPWDWAVLKLVLVGLAFMIAAAWIFQRALTKGVRA